MSKMTILSFSHALPDGRLTNDELSARLGVSPEEIFLKTGIRMRARAESESLVDLAVESAESALGIAGIPPAELDFLIVATSVPPKPMPALANLVLEKLGGSCLAFDMNASCSGFKYGLTIADALLRKKSGKGLLIGADFGTKMVDYNKPGPSFLFGDGAGAFVLGTSEQGFVAHYDFTQSEFASVITIEPGAFMEMAGHRVFAEAVSGMSRAASGVCQEAGLTLADVDWIIPHQANFRIIEAVSWKLGVPLDKFVIDIEDIGNTAAASIPIAFSRASRSGKIHKGQTLLFVAYAAGFSGGASLLRYG